MIRPRSVKPLAAGLRARAPPRPAARGHLRLCRERGQPGNLRPADGSRQRRADGDRYGERRRHGDADGDQPRQEASLRGAACSLSRRASFMDRSLISISLKSSRRSRASADSMANIDVDCTGWSFAASYGAVGNKITVNAIDKGMASSGGPAADPDQAQRACDPRRCRQPFRVGDQPGRRQPLGVALRCRHRRAERERAGAGRVDGEVGAAPLRLGRGAAARLPAVRAPGCVAFAVFDYDAVRGSRGLAWKGTSALPSGSPEAPGSPICTWHPTAATSTPRSAPRARSPSTRSTPPPAS